MPFFVVSALSPALFFVDAALFGVVVSCFFGWDFFSAGKIVLKSALPSLFGGVRVFLWFFMESLILAQDERWRRA